MNAKAVLDAFLVTVEMCLVTLVGAGLLAIPIAYARMCRFSILRFAAAIFIVVIRGIPPLAWLFIAFFAVHVGDVKPSAMTAALATLIVVNSAYFAEIYRAGIDSVHTGLKEAAMALGLSGRVRMRFVVLPLAMRIIVGSSSSIAITIVKDTSIASLIGARELTHYASAKVADGGDGMVYFTLIGVIYLGLSFILGALARHRSSVSSVPVSV
jgi:polar amino acid transport system permease protein